MTDIAQVQESPMEPSSQHRISRHTLWFLLIYYSLAISWGVWNACFLEPPNINALFTILLAICLGTWAIVDARRSGHTIPLFSKPSFFLLYGLVVPGYIIWSRGWRGVGWLSFNLFVWYIVAYISSYIVVLVVYYANQ